MTATLRKLLLFAAACAVVALPIGLSKADPAPPQLDALQKEYIDAFNKARDSVMAVIVGDQVFTGFFISDDGLIMTNGDVGRFGRTNAIVLGFVSGERREAKLVATDPYNQICLLKADPKGAKGLTLGTSTGIKVGTFVMTFGNVFGSIQNDEEVSFSVGMVSGIYRLTGDAVYSGTALETDASINAGADGGPMLDAEGKVVGVIARTYARTRFLGTAAPIDQITLVLEDLKAAKPIYSGYFGASYKDAVITDVDKGSPAEQAGLKKDDKITEIDSVLIKDDNDISIMLSNSPAGATANITVKRGEEEIIMPVTLGKGVQGKEIALPAGVQQPPKPAREQPPAPGEAPYIGFTLADKDGGVEVVEVTPGSPAASAIISVGLKLASVDGKAVASVAEFDAIFATMKPGQEVTMVFTNSQGWEKQVKVVVGKRVGRRF